MWYRLYVEGVYLGEGYIPYLIIPPGSTHKFEFQLDLNRAGEMVQRAFLKENVITNYNVLLRVPAKFLGLFTWKTFRVNHDGDAIINVSDAIREQLEEKLRAPADRELGQKLQDLSERVSSIDEKLQRIEQRLKRLENPLKVRR